MPFKKRKELLREVINTFVAERKAASAEEEPQPEEDAEPEEAAAGEEVRPWMCTWESGGSCWFGYLKSSPDTFRTGHHQ